MKLCSVKYQYIYFYIKQVLYNTRRIHLLNIIDFSYSGGVKHDVRVFSFGNRVYMYSMDYYKHCSCIFRKVQIWIMNWIEIREDTKQ